MRYLVFLFVCLLAGYSIGHADGLAGHAHGAGVDGGVPTEPPKTIELPAGVNAPRAMRLCSPDNPRIGTEVSCLISVIHSKAFSVSISVPPGFSAMDQGPAKLDDKTGDLITTREVAVTPMSMRKLKLFGFSIAWSHETGAQGKITLKDEYILMASMMGDIDEPTFRTFREPTPDFPEFWGRHGVLPLIETNWYLMVGMMVLVLGAALSLIIVYVQRIRAQRRQAAIPWVDPRPAHVIANESLEMLAVDALPEKGMILEFYLRLSEILRIFLENRFGIAIERGRGLDGQMIGLRFTAATAEEIEMVLTGRPEMTHDGFKALMECLGVIDYVVFGGLRPHVGQTEADRRRIRFCIELNRSVEPQAPLVPNAVTQVDQVERIATETDVPAEVTVGLEQAIESNRTLTKIETRSDKPEVLPDRTSIDPGADQ
jgi:hypothetical protein